MSKPLNTTDQPNILQGTQKTATPIVPIPRVDQTQIIPGSIHPRHLENKLFGVHLCVAADVTKTDGKIYPVLFSIDDNTLHCYNGSAYVTTVLT